VAEKKLHLPLNSYVERDKYDLADFRPDSINLYRWNGELYALPRDYGNQNLFYNIDLLEKTGVKPPPADWADTSFTFAAFVDMVRALTKRSGDRFEQYGFLVNRGWRPWASWVYNNGAAVVKTNEQGLATEIALTDPAAIEALQLLQDLWKFSLQSNEHSVKKVSRHFPSPPAPSPTRGRGGSERIVLRCSAPLPLVGDGGCPDKCKKTS
jgi:ABC-type glycerol-3-phosphate transport system substrate-binding protein